MSKLLVTKVVILCLYSISVILGASIPASDGTNSRLQATDLKLDYLTQRVYSFLDGEGLLNVSEANIRLTETADYEFRHDHEKIHHISDRGEVTSKPEDNNTAMSKRIFLNSATVHAMMSNDGESIRELSIDI